MAAAGRTSELFLCLLLFDDGKQYSSKYKIEIMLSQLVKQAKRKQRVSFASKQKRELSDKIFNCFAC